MQIHVSDEAAAFVRERGGRLYVWANGAACCGGTRFIEASTDVPRGADRFVPTTSTGIELLVRPANAALPDELSVALKGWRRPRVEATWNGCAYLV